MMNTWILAALLAEAADGPTKPEAESNRIVVSVPNGTMICTKNGDQLVCVLPLREAITDEPQLFGTPPPKAPPYTRSPPTPALPDPQLLSQLKLAERNIALAKSLLPRATTPERAVLAQQLLYWANEQYKWTKALLPAKQEELRRAPDPFDREEHIQARKASDMPLSDTRCSFSAATLQLAQVATPTAAPVSCQ